MQDLIKLILSNFAPAILTPDPRAVEASPTGKAIVAVRDGYKLAEVEHRRAPRPGRRHTFHDIEGFASFVKRHLGDPGTVEILAGENTIVALSGAAYWRDEVSCIVPAHPLMLAWAKLLNQPMKQADLYKRLAPLASSVGGGFLTALSQIDLSTATEANYKLNEHGAYDVIAKRQTTSGTSKLPSRFGVTVPVYIDTDPVTFTVAVTLEPLVPGHDPVFTLLAVDLDEVKLRAYRAKVGDLADHLGADYLVGMGVARLEQ